MTHWEKPTKEKKELHRQWVEKSINISMNEYDKLIEEIMNDEELMLNYIVVVENDKSFSEISPKISQYIESKLGHIDGTMLLAIIYEIHDKISERKNK